MPPPSTTKMAAGAARRLRRPGGRPFRRADSVAGLLCCLESPFTLGGCVRLGVSPPCRGGSPDLGGSARAKNFSPFPVVAGVQSVCYCSNAMHYDRIIRFLAAAFIIGGVLGLVSGLVVGRSGNAVAQSAAEVSADSSGGSEAASTGQGSAPAEPMTPDKARTIGANELGMVLVLEYHRIIKSDDQTATEPDYCRSALHFRQDVELLKSKGYYPITVKELASGNIDVPAGKSPVALTFDDSSIGQYRVLDDGTIDPDCAVGILQAASKDGSWPLKASFYPLLDVDLKEHILFGQPDLAQAKLQKLVAWGCEIGSHTYTHLNLKTSTEDVVRKELALSKKKLEDMIGGGYKVYSLSIPLGEYPSDIGIIESGEYEGVSYSYKAALEVAGGPSYSPFSSKFDPLHILRIPVQGDSLTTALKQLSDSSGLRYVSDGDPSVVSFPADLPDSLGTAKDNLQQPVVTY